MTSDRLTKINTINKIYRKILGRDADQSGISSYIHLLSNPYGTSILESILLSSDEYKKKQQEKLIKNTESFSSLTGDRTSYVKDKDTSIIDKSRFSGCVNSILKRMIYIENEKYPLSKLYNRISTIKQSLIHIAKKELNFTVFPHLEHYFNTDKFNTSLLISKNFEYFVLFIALLNIWKKIFEKTVPTCGTDNIVQSLTKEFNSIDEIDIKFKNFILDYLSIRLIGRLLSNKEREDMLKFFYAKSYNKIMLWFINENHSLSTTSNEIAKKGIHTITNKLGRKPKVLIMIAYLETQNSKFIDYMLYNLEKIKKINMDLDIEFALDNERVDREPNDYTPWSRVKRIRNLMIEKYPIYDYDYLYIIDSDIIDYPHNFISRAIGLNPDGITAPMALIQYSTVFYDWCGYQKLGVTSIRSQYADYILEKAYEERNFSLNPPYTPDPSYLAQLDCVGCTYVVPTKVFAGTYGDLQMELLEVFDIAGVTDHKILDNKVQYEDHPSFTDHYTICAATRAGGGKILMDRLSPAYHADLPLFGENWH